MLCPTCKHVELVMSERKGVEIDYCPQCRGVWLDRGEIDKIIERSVAEEKSMQPQANHPPAHYSDGRSEKHRDHSGYQKHYKKKSIWHELFD